MRRQSSLSRSWAAFSLGILLSLFAISFASSAFAAPIISAYTPQGGPVGSLVDFVGSGFGATQGSSTVTFNGVPATFINLWTATQIGITIPVGATSGNVVVTVGGVASNSVAFEVSPPPVISSISPTSGTVGAQRKPPLSIDVLPSQGERRWCATLKAAHYP
jgi:IPT/TIG domain